MNLRNKKTGEIKSIEEIIRDAFLSNELDSLKSIDANWEDVKEPLVGGKSQRAVLRAAARLSDTDVATVFRSDIAEIVVFDFRGQCRVELKDRGINVKNRGAYTITELCGEEEECES